MTTQKDILRAMMTQLDEDSDKIPEGLYLKFCDHLKNLHTCQPASFAPQRSSGPRRERKAVYRINYPNESPLRGGKVVVSFDLPGVELHRQSDGTLEEITIKVGQPDVVFIRVPGKYKQLIFLPVKVLRGGDSVDWNPQTHCLKITLQMMEA